MISVVHFAINSRVIRTKLKNFVANLWAPKQVSGVKKKENNKIDIRADIHQRQKYLKRVGGWLEEAPVSFYQNEYMRLNIHVC